MGDEAIVSYGHGRAERPMSDHSSRYGGRVRESLSPPRHKCMKRIYLLYKSDPISYILKTILCGT